MEWGIEPGKEEVAVKIFLKKKKMHIVSYQAEEEGADFYLSNVRTLFKSLKQAIMVSL